MTRLRRSMLTLGMLAVVFAAAGCGGSSGTPTAPPISDPKEIIARSLLAAQAAKTFHMEATLTGTIDTSSLGDSGSSLGGSIKLDGSKITGDVDIPKQAAHVNVSMPTFLGLEVDLIQVDGFDYTKISLMSDKYSKSPASDLPIASEAPTSSMGLHDAITEIQNELDQAGATVKLTGREKIDGQDAYHVTIDVPQSAIDEALGAAGSEASGVSVTSVSLDYWVYTASVLPARFTAKAETSLGNFGMTVTLSNYNKPVTIKAPPADQIDENAQSPL